MGGEKGASKTRSGFCWQGKEEAKSLERGEMERSGKRMQNPGRIRQRREEWGGGELRHGQMHAGYANLGLDPSSGDGSNASCLMQWKQVRPGLMFPDLGSQGAPGGGRLAAEEAYATPIFLAATCKGVGQKEGWTLARGDLERWLHRSEKGRADSGSRGDAPGVRRRGCHPGTPDLQ